MSVNSYLDPHCERGVAPRLESGRDGPRGEDVPTDSKSKDK